MKKIFLVLFIVLCAGTAFAETTIVDDAQTLGTSGTSFTPSTNVTVNAGTNTAGTEFTAASFHSSGNTGYATTQDSGIASNSSATACATGFTVGALPDDYSL
jgi:hypothetical protein